MQKARFYLLDSTIIDGYVNDSGIGNLRLIDLLNSSVNKRKMGEGVFLSIKSAIQMIFVKKQIEDSGEESAIFTEEQEEKEVPLDFILDESLQLEKTLSFEDSDYTVSLNQILFAHSMSEFKGVKNERARALKNLIPVSINILTINNYMISGNLMVPAISKGELPKDIYIGKHFVVLSEVKLKYLPSKKNYYRFHDHLIVNTQLIKAFY
ncbi:hypothetical protein TTHT_0941 [Thermotomaculum hydrothermale]|uniref:Uncharacterized protein n=1 Tax=Thermotomaculum hydrothermale TaxID=981385 RepID=A0A7R6PXG1_9BACT|nr:hypothetical protein [Thermotomaculum hydrothermale]BBB32495.1 hypothetical protein TTHT_0941 [Thermotomaculum hydrothermale]